MNSDILEYEKQLVEVMIDESCTFLEAMTIIFDMNGVDKTSVFDMVDFLESQVGDLNLVDYYMRIWTGLDNDMELNPYEEKKKE